MALLAPALIAMLGSDGVLSRLDAALLFAVFGAWLGMVVRAGYAERRGESATASGAAAPIAVVRGAAGLALLVVAGDFIVDGARGIAASFGLDGFLVGATIIALGTSVPELSTAVVAMLRRHSDVALGTVLGSNIFNALFVVPVATAIHPIAIHWRGLGPVLAAGLVALALAFPGRDHRIGRRRGAALLLLYAGYVAAVGVSS
jgi:cation:H+ antiporter